MSFNPNNLIKLQPSTLLTQPATIPGVLPTKTAASIWTYQAGSDTKANVEAAGYFVYFANFDNTLLYDNGQFLQVGDLIYCACTDGGVQLVVNSITGTITTTTYAPPPSGITPPANGGTGLDDPTAHGIMIGEGANAMNALVLTNGQLLIGSTGLDPVPGSITPGAGITVTPGAGTITIASSVAGTVAPQVLYNAAVGGTYSAQWPGSLVSNTSTNTLATSDNATFHTNVVFMPFYVPNNYTPANLSIVVEASLASTSVNIGLYAANVNGYQPAGAATHIINPATTGNGTVSTAWTPALVANTLYFIGIQFSTNLTISLSGYGLNGIINYGAGNNGLNAGTIGGLVLIQSNAFSAGVMPAASPTGSAQVLTFPVINFL